MKKLITIISLIALGLNLFSHTASADGDSHGWYAVNKNGKISFPADAELIESHGGIYLDASNTGEKKLYLTFDAGYENGNIEKILNTLKEKDVPAAFFILSNLILKNTDLVSRMASEGHTVCNHTKNHKDVCKLTNEETLANLQALEMLYEERVGEKMTKYFRFPEGKYSLEKVALLNENGYTPVFWSLAYDDWDDNRQPSPNAAIKKLISRTHDGAVILLHPTSKTNAQILPTLIDKWREMGYTFGTLDEI